MPGRIVHILNPKDDPYRKGKRPKPDNTDQSPLGRGPTDGLRAVVQRQRDDGLFAMPALVLACNGVAGWTAERCTEVVRAALPEGARAENLLVASVGVLVALDRGFGSRERQYFLQAYRFCMDRLKAALRTDEAGVKAVLNRVSQVLVSNSGPAKQRMASDGALTLSLDGHRYRRERGEWENVTTHMIPPAAISEKLDAMARRNCGGAMRR